MANVLVNINDEILARVDAVVHGRKVAHFGKEIQPLTDAEKGSLLFEIEKVRLKSGVAAANEFVVKHNEKIRNEKKKLSPSRVQLINELVELGLAALSAKV